MAVRAATAAKKKIPEPLPQTAVESFAAQVCAVRPFPQVVARIHAVAANPSASMNRIADVVESDVGFSARVLAVVNSAAMGLVRPCSTIRNATTLLGTRGIANLATAVASLAIVDNASANHPDIAKHALRTAGIARHLAPLCGISADEAFTAALLHDIGLLMLLQSGDELYEELIDQMPEGEEPSLADEKALLGFDHADLGGQVLRRWNVPDPLPYVVELHHDLDAAIVLGAPIASLTALVRLADVLAHRVAHRSQPNEDDIATLREERSAAFLKLTADDLLARWVTFVGAGDGWSDPAPRSAGEPDPDAPPSPALAPAAAPQQGRFVPPVIDEEGSNQGMLIGVGITVALAAASVVAFLALR